jgi:hypothetical protein
LAFPVVLKGTVAVVATTAPLQATLAAKSATGLTPDVGMTSPRTSTSSRPLVSSSAWPLLMTQGAPPGRTPKSGGSVVRLPWTGASRSWVR